MVYYSEVAKSDLKDILWKLANWEKHWLSYEHAEKYVDEIRAECDMIDKISFHFDAQYETHKRYGDKVHTYKRNANTIWYIIYNKTGENIYVEKIISNYMTVS
ncbi:MAG: hypothetical protein FWD60_00985 [Candidatus Azobacteroides sp.]|nr:hypothetical protein [Candidatus Azobacteroides sp.]